MDRMDRMDKKMENILHMLSMTARNSELLHKHGACLISGYHCNPLALSYNHYEISRIAGIYIEESIHAEISTLQKWEKQKQMKGCNSDKIRRKKKKLILIIARLNNNQQSDEIFRHSEPCYHCLNYIKNSGIKKIAFTLDGGRIQCKKDKSNGIRKFYNVKCQ